MREQLASRRGIREQKRICWRVKPAATDESLYKQPVKPSAQVGTLTHQTISRGFIGLSGAAAQTKLGGSFSVINSGTETHDGGGRQCAQIQMQGWRWAPVHANNQIYTPLCTRSENHTFIQVFNETHHGATYDFVWLSCKCRWLLWQSSVTSRLTAFRAEMTPDLDINIFVTSRCSTTGSFS